MDGKLSLEWYRGQVGLHQCLGLLVRPVHREAVAYARFVRLTRASASSASTLPTRREREALSFVKRYGWRFPSI